jgi:uncharacterized protein YbbC (DUF1343 family)
MIQCRLLCLALASALPLPAQVLCGIDVLARDRGKPLHDCKIGLVTNHTGLARDGTRTIDVLRALPELSLRAIFSPEHGLQGKLDRDGIGHGKDESSGLPVWSLYGETRKPTKEMLQDIDTLVFDIQDIGCRFYTYVSTMGNCLEAAAEHGLRFVVLDRPNPIGGVAIAGPVLDEGKESFTAWHRLPLRHGMTAGELLRMFAGERGIRCETTIIPCEGWARSDLFHDTGLTWTDPSPNMRNLTEALLYPGVGLLETTNLSVGRGTDTPFERIGAPWCDGVRLAARLRTSDLKGVAFVSVRFTPTASKFEGKQCSGVQIAITDWGTFEPVLTGIAIACALRDLFASDWKTDKLDTLWKHKASLDAFAAGADARAIEKTWAKDLDLFRLRRKPFLLYP